MSWSIPTQVEQDIIAGKAVYKTFQTGNGGQSILPVPANSYAVIFGYDFSPAGGGFRVSALATASPELTPAQIRWFETQQISFYTGTDFYPFIHHVDTNYSGFVQGAAQVDAYTIDNSPISRQVYITSSNDITITVGLILTSNRTTASPIPVTSRTPFALTYGGSPQTPNTQTDFGPAGTPLQFMQPSPKDYQDFGLGILPSNADGQAFATPDIVNGLYEPSTYLRDVLGGSFANAAACNYYLNLHYALYNKTTPETRG